jgi:hypothetical protein
LDESNDVEKEEEAEEEEDAELCDIDTTDDVVLLLVG